MDPSSFASPEAAAVANFPPKYCRVVASRSAGDRAYVLLDTNAGSLRSYLYGVECQRVGSGWVELGSSNGGGWSEQEGGLGLLSFWDEAPPNADRVRVMHGGVIFEEAVENGAYLFVWFNEPFPSGWPEATSFRVAGRWIKRS